MSRRIACKLSGKNDVLVPIYYAGHGVEVGAGGQMMLVPVDARPDDPTLHFSKAQLTCDLLDINTRRIQQAFNIKQVRRATFVVIADCCRESPSSPAHFITHLSSQSLSRAGSLAAGNTNRPRFLFAFACDPGRAARE